VAVAAGHHEGGSRAVTLPRRLLAILACTVVILAVAADRGAAGMRGDAGLPGRELLEPALAAFRRVERAGLVRTRLLTLIDYARPSSQRRLWVIDPDHLRVLTHEFVAHGRGSAAPEDPDRAVRFGNQPESHRSSLGTFLTGDTYQGKHGHSLKLIGLDRGVNDLAEERRIVIHSADYVSAAFRAQSGGRVGRSWGCPAIDPAVGAGIIDRIQDGSVVYVTGREAPPQRTTGARAEPDRRASR
jgi:L,D-transpeptidase catalytic domain